MWSWWCQVYWFQRKCTIGYYTEQSIDISSTQNTPSHAIPCHAMPCHSPSSTYIGARHVSCHVMDHIIWQNVFPWLAEHAIPFVFTSSYLQAQPTSYGSIKRLGESWINTVCSYCHHTIMSLCHHAIHPSIMWSYHLMWFE